MPSAAAIMHWHAAVASTIMGLMVLAPNDGCCCQVQVPGSPYYAGLTWVSNLTEDNMTASVMKVYDFKLQLLLTQV